MFLVRKLKNINWEYVEFNEEKSQFLHFLVVYDILSETEIWPFLRLLRMDSSEMQYRDQLNWTKELNRLLLKPNTVIDVRVSRASTFAT